MLECLLCLWHNIWEHYRTIFSKGSSSPNPLRIYGSIQGPYKTWDIEWRNWVRSHCGQLGHFNRSICAQARPRNVYVCMYVCVYICKNYGSNIILGNINIFSELLLISQITHIQIFWGNGIKHISPKLHRLKWTLRSTNLAKYGSLDWCIAPRQYYKNGPLLSGSLT